MICRLVQYRIACDVPGCRRGTGAKCNEQAAIDEAVGLGWDFYKPAHEDADTLFRCPRCVAACQYPADWPKCHKARA